MYDYIKGLLTYKSLNSKSKAVTVETSGIGYIFEVLERDYSQLTDENKEVKIYASLIHKEDKMSLCGFLKREDRDMFNVLTGVSGVGLKMALTLLDSFSTSDLISLVLNEDYKSIMSAKGVGQKLAQKIIIELKGKLNSYSENQLSSGQDSGTFDNENIKDAKMVLLSLGYEKSEIEKSIDIALKSLDSSSGAEEILKKTLQVLSLQN